MNVRYFEQNQTICSSESDLDYKKKPIINPKPIVPMLCLQNITMTIDFKTLNHIKKFLKY